MDANDILGKVNNSGGGEGCCISWSDQVEKKRPSGLKKKPLSGFKKKRPQTISEVLGHPVSYPHEIRVGKHLAMKQGKGMGDEEEEKRLETEYVNEIFRKRGACTNSDIGKPPKVNMESMGEEEVMAVIRGWEGGPMIRSRRDPADPSKFKHYFVLLSMSPHQFIVKQETPKEEEEKSGTDSSEPRPEKPGLPFKPLEDQPKGPEEAMKMEKNAKRREKKLIRAKRHDERQAKSDRAKRSRAKARMQRHINIRICGC